jgi:hypothetical protein
MSYIIRDPQKSEYVKQELTHIVSEALAGFFLLENQTYSANLPKDIYNTLGTIAITHDLDREKIRVDFVLVKRTPFSKVENPATELIEGGFKVDRPTSTLEGLVSHIDRDICDACVAVGGYYNFKCIKSI